MNENEKQFSFTRAASSTSGRARKQFLISISNSIKALLLCTCLATASMAQTYTITIYSYPALGSPGSILGLVSGPNPGSYWVAIVDDVFGTFWSKPYDYQPYVGVAPNGNFNAVFNTGGNDICAQKIYLYLVPSGSSIPLVLGGSGVPPGLIAMSVASAVVDRTSTADYLNWSGIDWKMKDTGGCTWGPGPNYFSRNSVSVDSSNRLHMAVTYTNGAWRCPEIISSNSFGYGLYTFEMDSVRTNLDGQIVVGLFVYDDDAAEYHSEIDVEFSNGPVVGSDAPWQYVVQPYNLSGHRLRFNFPTNSNGSTHSFLWSPGITHFDSFYKLPVRTNAVRATFKAELRPEIDIDWRPLFNFGSFDMLIRPGVVSTHTNTDMLLYYDPFYMRAFVSDISIDATPTSFEAWSAIYGIPHPGQEKVHINAWLFNGSPPTNTNNVFEVVVKKFSFQPLDVSSLRSKLRITNMKQELGGNSMDVILTVPAQ